MELITINKKPTESELFYRKCDCCGNGMNEGYVFMDKYYCGDQCLSKTHSQSDIDELLSEEDGDNYWTDWEGGDYQYQFINGELKEVE